MEPILSSHFPRNSYMIGMVGKMWTNDKDTLQDVKFQSLIEGRVQ